ncbi:MAG: sorbosone dehydrogenase family protein [Pirellulales bacterium]
MLRRTLIFAFSIALTLSVVGFSSAAFRVERVAAGLNQPTFVAQAPGDDGSLYIVERQGASGGAGRILKRNLATGTSTTFLDFAGSAFTGDGGVLSLAFHPDFAANGKFYVATSFNGGVNNLRNRVQEFRVVGGVPQFERTLLEYDNLLNPFHTVNMMAFNPLAVGVDRNYMTIQLGDGGTQADQDEFVNNSQDLSKLYGKILRVDVSDGADAYPTETTKNFGIPAGNPYASDGNPNTLGEIYASGFREPFRGSYDRLTGDYYVGDVGFNTKEEINFIKADSWGTDFGWARREGTIQTPAPSGGPQGTSINPIFQLDHNTGNQSFTGGYVYRGPVTELQGTYFFSDFVSGKIFSGNFDRNTSAASFNGANLTNFQDRTSELESLVLGGADLRNITSFAEDNAGNLYLVKFGNAFFPPNGQGEVFRIVPGSLGDRSDINFDGVVDADDWVVFLTYNKTSLAGLTPDESHARGDLDGDIDNDFADFQIFRGDYNAIHGAGAFDALLAHVPEPSTCAATVAAAAALCIIPPRKAQRPFWANAFSVN